MSTLGYMFVAGCNADTFTNANDSDMLIYPQSSTQRILIGVQTGSTATMTISSNIGINTSNPTETLAVAGSFSLSNYGKSVFYTSNNNIGIGISNPTAALHVVGGTTVQGDLTIGNAIGIKGLTIYKRDGGNANVTSTSVLGFSNDSTGVTIRTTSNSQHIYILTSNTERMRITEQGIVNFTSNLTITGHIIPNSNITYDLGTSNLRFKDLYLSGNTIIFGDTRISTSSNGGIVVTNSNGQVSDSTVSQITLSNFGETAIYTSNNNIGIGTSNPLSALDVVGSLRLSSNIIANTTDTSNHPAYTWFNDVSTGMYHQGTGQIGFSTQGTSVMTLCNGTVSISSNLTVMGQLTVSNVTYVTSNVTIYASESVQSNLSVVGVTTLASNLTMSNYGMLSLYTSNSYLGIAKSNPEYTVDITGNVNFSGNLYQNGAIFTSGGGGGGGWSNTSTNIFVIGSNVGIGTQAPTEALQVSGGKVFSDTQILGTSNDSSNIPSFSFKQDSNTGIFHPTTGQLGITAAGSNVFMASPSNILLNTSVQMPSTVTFAGFSITQRTDATTLMTVPQTWTNSACNVYITGSNVGIGKTNPAFPLDVNGIINATNLYVAGAPYIGSQWANSNNIVYLLNSNVGIGTSNPTSTLTVNGTLEASSNPYCFLSGNTGQTTVLANSKIPFNIVLTDVTSSWNTTNKNYTAPKTGKYLLTFNPYLSAGGGRIMIYINNVVFEYLLHISTTLLQYSSSVVLYLNQNDVVDLRPLNGNVDLFYNIPSQSYHHTTLTITYIP